MLNLGRMLNRFGNVSVVIVTPEHEGKKRFANRRECKVRGVIRPLPIVPLQPQSTFPKVPA